MEASSLVTVNVDEFNKFCLEFEKVLSQQYKAYKEADKEYTEDFFRKRSLLDRLFRIESPYMIDNQSRFSWSSPSKVEELVDKGYLFEIEVSLLIGDSSIWSKSHRQEYSYYLRDLKGNLKEGLMLSGKAYEAYENLTKELNKFDTGAANGM